MIAPMISAPALAQAVGLYGRPISSYDTFVL
jgi:hypothetical protein